MIGGTAYVFRKAPWLLIPSSVKKLLRFGWPFTAGNEQSPIGLCVPPPEFASEMIGDTPGVSERSCVKFLPLSGRSTTCCVVTTAPSSDVELCTAAPKASTTTDSCTAPTRSVASKVAVWFTSIRKAEILSLLKPALGTSSVYTPGATFRNTYAPATFVTVVRSTAVSTLRRTTLVSGIVLPLLSRTVPLMEPVVSCAQPGCGAIAAKQITSRIETVLVAGLEF